MSSLSLLLLLCSITLATAKPASGHGPEAREIETQLMSIGNSATSRGNPISEYILQSPDSRNVLQPGSRREITHFQTFPLAKRKIITADAPLVPSSFRRDPNSTPKENFNGFIMAGRKPSDNLVMSPVLSVSESTKNQTYTKVDMFPAVATVVQTYDERGRLRGTVTRYEPAGKTFDTPANINTRQQITWPYAGYFPILIKDPFLTAFNSYATGTPFSWSSLVEYGPDADICRSGESLDDHAKHETENETEMRSARKASVDNEKKHEGVIESSHEKLPGGSPDDQGVTLRRKRSNRILIDDPIKGQTTLKIDDIIDSESPQLTVRKGGVAIAGPGGAATAYTGGTAIVGPYGTVYKSPGGVAIAGPYSRIINITDDTSFTDILRMHEASKKNKTIPKARQADDGPRFRVFRNLFAYKSSKPLIVLRQSSVRSVSNRKESEDWKEIWEKWRPKNNESTLILAPKSKAEAGTDGVAISAPISHAVIYPNRMANIVFEPQSSASAGPGGLAHAHSDLLVSYIKNITRLSQ